VRQHAYGDHLIQIARHTVAVFPPGYRVRFSGSLASVSAANEVMVHGKVAEHRADRRHHRADLGILLRSVVGGLLVATPLALTLAVRLRPDGLVGLPLDTNTVDDRRARRRHRRRLRHLLHLPPARGAGPRAEPRNGHAPRPRDVRKSRPLRLRAIAAGYLTLCLSGFSHYVRMGALIAAAMVVSSLSTLALLPALVTILKPSFLGIRERRSPNTADPTGIPMTR
jgi:hypothetical protein